MRKKGVIRQPRLLLLRTYLGANSLPSQAWFFFFLPGSVTGAIGDAITGSEGANCVPEAAKVGDKIRMPNGGIGTIKSLSGTSIRCNDAAMPMRALIVTNDPTANPEPTVNPAAVASIVVPGVDKLTFDLPVGFDMKPITDAQKNISVVFYAINRTSDIGVLVIAEPHAGVTDLMSYAMTKRANQEGRLADTESSEITKMNINGRPAYRYEVSGSLKTAMKLTYTTTIIEGADQIILVNAWTGAANFIQRKSEMENLAERVNGIPPPVSQNLKPTEVKPQVEAVTSPPVMPTVVPIPLISSDKPATASEKLTGQTSTAQKLKELNALYKDKLINKSDFEAKKQEILKGL